MRSGPFSLRPLPGNDILAVLGVVGQVLEPRGMSMAGLLVSWQVQGGQRWNAHGAELSSPKSRTSATFVARTNARRTSLEGGHLLPSLTNRSPHLR
jgi:hypothetical protein